MLSLNPRFIRAHQLLALFYMDAEEWERAERELHKCMEIDRNKTQTLRYLNEVDRMLTPDETSRQTGRKKKEEAVRYQSDNEIIIQPLNVKEPKGGGVSTLVNIGIGLLIGLAATYFLLVPAAQSNARNEAQKTITTISNESDAKTARIQELESENGKLQEEIEGLQAEVEGFVGEDGTLQSFDNLLNTASDYLETQDIQKTAAELETIAANINIEETSESYQKLYQTLLGAIGPQLAQEYYAAAQESYRQENFAEAAEGFGKAVYYDATLADAWYYLGQAYRRNGDTENALAAYRKVVELFPDTSRARSAQEYISQLGTEN